MNNYQRLELIKYDNQESSINSDNKISVDEIKIIMKQYEPFEDIVDIFFIYHMEHFRNYYTIDDDINKINK